MKKCECPGTGGPACPTPTPNSNHGMTLRDWFAGQALVGMLSYYNGTRGDYHTNASVEVAAHDAYEWADAMLKARNA